MLMNILWELKQLRLKNLIKWSERHGFQNPVQLPLIEIEYTLDKKIIDPEQKTFGSQPKLMK